MTKKPASPARKKKGKREREQVLFRGEGDRGVLHPRDHNRTPVRGGVEALGGVRVSLLLERRLAGTSLIVRDVVHHHLLVVRGWWCSLRERVHTGRAAGEGVAIKGVRPVGAGGMPRGGIAGWRGGVLWGHDLGVLVGGDHLSVGHDRHLSWVWHGKPLHGDHVTMRHAVVEGHDGDATGGSRGDRDQAGRIMDVTLLKREREKVLSCGTFFVS